jgi:DNA polymerase-3 subunit epsilon
MFSPYTVFLDLETTGLSPRDDGITEIGVIVLREGEAPREWSTLVKPPRPIPPEIAAMTGITNEMVRDAPRFAEVAPRLAELLEGAVLVAHNARFDYAFLKQAFAREGLAFFVPTLCTARLARELEPELESAGLDALASRYRLAQADRHRAMGDARITHALARAMASEFEADDLEAAVKRVLRRPSLPKHLPVDTLVNIPEGPGVYLFYGLNAHPLYIGKAKSLRERIGSHFSGDWTSERGARLSEELRRIEWMETAGELSALLLEAELVRDRLPSHNVLLRRRTEPVAIVLNHETRTVEYRAASGLTYADLDGLHGPYSSRASARATLTALADEYHLCLKTLGLERKRKNEAPQTSCFAWQVKRCLGACIGEESLDAHWARLVEALAPARMPPWPHEGPVELIERDPDTGREARVVVDRWCIVNPSGAVQYFDRETYRVLRPYVEGRKRKSAVVMELRARREVPEEA